MEDGAYPWRPVSPADAGEYRALSPDDEKRRLRQQRALSRSDRQRDAGRRLLRAAVRSADRAIEDQRKKEEGVSDPEGGLGRNPKLPLGEERFLSEIFSRPTDPMRSDGRIFSRLFRCDQDILDFIAMRCADASSQACGASIVREGTITASSKKRESFATMAHCAFSPQGANVSDRSFDGYPSKGETKMYKKNVLRPRKANRRLVALTLILITSSLGGVVAPSPSSAAEEPNGNRTLVLAQAGDCQPNCEGRLEPKYQPREPEEKSWFNGAYVFGLSRSLAASTIASPAKAPLFLFTVPLDIALFPFSLIGGMFG